MSRGKLRFPMFFKFLVGCLSLAAMLIIGGTYVLKQETRLKSRGNYLQKQDRRLDGYMTRIGRDMTGITELIASTETLRSAMASPQSIGIVEAKAPDAPALARRMYEALNSKYGIKPDAFAVFTVGHKLVFSAPEAVITEDVIDELAPVERVRSGGVFSHRFLLLNGEPFQVSAAPVRAPGADTVVGGVLIGVRMQRYFEEFAEQSDEEIEKQIRATVMDGSKVIASAWPSETWPELVKQATPEQVVRVAVGDDVRDVIRLAQGDFDFYSEASHEGFQGLEPTGLGRMVITRSRTNVVDPASQLPWRSILAGIIASLVIASLMAFWITRPIKQFVKQSREMLAGETDLNHKIIVNSADETSDLAENINQLFGRLHALATGVQAAAFQVGASSAEISAASREMLGGLKDQTLKIESSTTAVTELSASIQQVAGNAKEATDVAEQSSTAVNAAVQRMLQIRSAVEDAGAKMRELGESSKRIGNIVEVIRQISEQTSMLALNASIEAAHAGEQGRGFAVVADEVSSLARRVGQSAKDIEALIQTVKEQTQAAITSMEQGTREVENGSQLVTSTLTGLGQLVAVVKDTATAVQEQAMVSDEIARNMDAVRHIATEVLSGSEESVVQAERLHELAFELEESIGGFNLDGSKLAKRSDPPAPPSRTLVAGKAAKRVKPAAPEGNVD